MINVIINTTGMLDNPIRKFTPVPIYTGMVIKLGVTKVGAVNPIKPI